MTGRINVSYVPLDGELTEKGGPLARAGQILMRSLNLLIDRTGGVTGSALPLRAYTVATLPSATVYAYHMVFVTNETGGATVAFSDSTNWRRVQDRAIVS
jgi:hypothetical protein